MTQKIISQEVSRLSEEEMILEEKPKKYTRLIVFLLIIAIGLIYLYWLLTRPLLPLNAPKLKGYTHLFSIYGYGSDRLSKPTEVAADKEGNIYVADTMKSRVMVFNGNGKYITQFGKKGSEMGSIDFPSSIAIDDNGRIYVTSYKLNKLVIFNQKYKPIQEITFKGLGPLTSTIKNNKLYVTARAGIFIGDLKGKLLTSFHKGGSKAGEFNRPTGIAVDDNENIYLADSMNYRVQAVDKRARSLWVAGAPPEWKSEGESFTEVEKKRQYGLPVSLALAPDGNLYVMDAFSGEIIIFDKKGNSLGKVGEWGQEDGQFYYPAGIASIGGDRFAVADKFNNRVQVVRIPSPTAGILEASGIPFNLIIFILLILALIITAIWAYYKRWKKRRELEEVLQTQGA